MANYRLCKVMEAVVSDDDCVRTVTIGYLPRKALKQMIYHPVPLEYKEVAVQRLVLILPVEEQTKKDGPGISHSDELELEREQPRASPTSTTTQSLPLTSRPGGPGWQCRAGLNYRLVHCVSTLCLMYISPHGLSENVIKDYEKESEPQKMPTPICPLLSQSVLGHLLAYIYYCVVDPIKICLSPSVKGALPNVAKEQHLYELNEEEGYPNTKMLSWREVHVSPDGSDDRDEGDDADDVTFKPKKIHGVFKPFFPSVGKIIEMVFRGLLHAYETTT